MSQSPVNNKFLSNLFTGKRTPPEQLVSPKTRNAFFLKLRILHSMENQTPSYLI